MPSAPKHKPSFFLVEPGFWRSRVAAMQEVHRGLIVCPRPDLTTPLVEAVEWRLKAHDGTRLRGIKGESRFHERPRGARLRFVPCCELPDLDLDTVAGGRLDVVFQTQVGRRLEDRVLDVLRVWQVIANHANLARSEMELVTPDDAEDADAFMIAEQLIASGLG